MLKAKGKVRPLGYIHLRAVREWTRHGGLAISGLRFLGYFHLTPRAVNKIPDKVDVEAAMSLPCAGR